MFREIFMCHVGFLCLKTKIRFLKASSYFPGSSDPAALCRLDQSHSAWQDENRGGATLSAGGPCCLYGPMLIKSSMAVFVLLHYTGWWSKCLCFSSLNAAGRDIRCPCGAVWWAGQVGLFCWKVKFFFKFSTTNLFIFLCKTCHNVWMFARIFLCDWWGVIVCQMKFINHNQSYL